MSNGEVGTVLQLLLVLLASAHLLGCVFVRLRQPRVIGEILAGLVLGNFLLGRLAPEASLLVAGGAAESPQAGVFQFVYWLGLLLLMLISGVEARQLFHRQDRGKTLWLAACGTALPFLLVIAAGPILPIEAILGPASQRTAALLVVGIAIAVTSIPVISRIFHDLGILHTRFASLVLGVAVLEDIALWAVLAVATAMASSAAMPDSEVAWHAGATLVYFAAGLTVGPALLRRLGAARWNVLASSSPIGWVFIVLFAYAAVAAALEVSLIFAAFLAGFGLRSQGGEPRSPHADALETISKLSFAVFIPAYFAIVGFRIDLGSSFSLTVLAVFLLAACAVKILSVALGARLAGFTSLDTLNLAIATNARGGPGIVLASVAFDAGIINAPFYSALVLLAVLTSQAAGAWLDFVVRRGWPLLSSEPGRTVTASEPGSTPALG